MNTHDIHGAGGLKRARSQPAALADVPGAESKQSSPTEGEVWSSSAEDADCGFSALIEEINMNSTHNYLLRGTTHNGTNDTWPLVRNNRLRDVEADALGQAPAPTKRSSTEKNDGQAPASTKRSRTEKSDGAASEAPTAQPAGEHGGSSTHDSLQSRSFLVLLSELEAQFLARTKASLGTHDIPDSVKEEQLANAFVAARLAMAVHGTRWMPC